MTQIETPLLEDTDALDILLVDDEAEILQVICEFLTDCGYRVKIAEDGRQALDILTSGAAIDLVVSDIRMPRLDGIKLLRHIRSHFGAMPVILMTGHGDDVVARTVLAEGACQYMQKPVRLSHLLACILAVKKGEPSA